MWHDTEEWAKATRPTKALNIVLAHMCVALWALLVIRGYQDFNQLSPPRLAESISVFVGGMATYLSFLVYTQERHNITKVINEVDRKCLSVPIPTDSPRYKQWLEETKRLYKTEGLIVCGCILTGVVLGFSQFLFVVMTGTLFYDSVIFISDESYSWPWWLQSVYQGGVVLHSGIFYSLKDFILLDIFYQLHRLFKVQADTIMELCLDENYDPEEEYKKLTGALKEILELYEWVI